MKEQTVLMVLNEIGLCLTEALTDLAMYYSANKTLGEAISTLEECHAVQLAFLPKLHPEVARSQ